MMEYKGYDAEVEFDDSVGLHERVVDCRRDSARVPPIH